MKAQAELDGIVGKITLFNTNGTISSEHYYDTTNEIENGI